MLTFKSKLHELYTMQIHKVILSYQDDKRKVKSDGINTYAWHHIEIAETNPDYELDVLLLEIEKLQEDE